MQYYYIKNWRRFQHYKHRNPPWIKLHQEIFTSADWLALADASKLLMIVCMVLAGRNKGQVPNDPAYIKRVAYLDKPPNLKPLIDCGFLIEVLADASECVQMLVESPESREQKDRKKLNGFESGLNGHSGKTKPRHGIKTKDHKRIWLDRETEEWKQYADDYRSAHKGINPPLQWENSGSWFNLMGEK